MNFYGSPRKLYIHIPHRSFFCFSAQVLYIWLYCTDPAISPQISIWLKYMLILVFYVYMWMSGSSHKAHIWSYKFHYFLEMQIELLGFQSWVSIPECHPAWEHEICHMINCLVYNNFWNSPISAGDISDDRDRTQVTSIKQSRHSRSKSEGSDQISSSKFFEKWHLKNYIVSKWNICRLPASLISINT